MSLPNDKVLLAFLLALRDLEAPLSDKERRTLKDLAGQLFHDSKNWEIYEPNLLELIKSNNPLNELYQVAQSQIDAIDDETLRKLLPTLEELEQAFPTPKQSTRGNQPNRNIQETSTEIANASVVVINVAEHDNPQEAAKKLTFLEKINPFRIKK
jgi:hypothetical protein